MKQFNTWKFVFFILLILVIVMFATLLQSSPKNEGVKKITIGFVGPLTGSSATIGQGMKNAMLLAQERSDTELEYELLFEDTENDATVSATVASKLIHIDNVDAIVSVTSHTGNIVSSMAEPAGVIHIGVSSDRHIHEGRYNFQHWTSPEATGDVYVKELQRLGLKRLAILELNQDGVFAINDAVVERLDGIELVFRENFDFGTKDFRTMILKAVQEEPDIILPLAFPPEIDVLEQQMKELGISIPRASIVGTELSDRPDLFEGQWYVNSADASQEFQELYTSRHGAIKIGTPNAYDAYNLLTTAFDRAEGDTHRAVDELLALKSFDGVLGELSVQESGEIESAAAVKEVRNGEYVQLG